MGETTRRILSFMVSHSLALSTNWSGRHNKGGLEKLKNVLKLIAASIRKNPRAANATDMEIYHTIQNWLRRAADREGGWAKRASSA